MSRIIIYGGGGGNQYLVKKLRLFAHGEPLLNPHLIEMTRYAKKADVAEVIELTTNATLLTKEFNEKIADAGMGIINISMNGLSAKDYDKNCGYKIDYEQFVDSIRDLYTHRKDCRIFIKLSDTGYSQEEKQKFFDTFGDICDQIFVEGMYEGYWQDTDVSEKIASSEERGLYGKKYERKKVCTTVFTTMIINSQGLVKLCCTDWKNEHIIGDLKTESIGSVWNGEKLRSWQKNFLLGKRENIPMCHECEWPEMSTPDNIDAYREMLLKWM